MKTNTPANHCLQLIVLSIFALVALSACDVFAPPTQSAAQPTATSPFGPIIQPDYTPATSSSSPLPPTQPIQSLTARATLPPTAIPTSGPTATGPTPKFGPIVGPNAVQPATATPATAAPT